MRCLNPLVKEERGIEVEFWDRDFQKSELLEEKKESTPRHPFFIYCYARGSHYSDETVEGQRYRGDSVKLNVNADVDSR